jgi:hypothetical protein
MGGADDFFCALPGCLVVVLPDHRVNGTLLSVCRIEFSGNPWNDPRQRVARERISGDWCVANAQRSGNAFSATRLACNGSFVDSRFATFLHLLCH